MTVPAERFLTRACALVLVMVLAACGSDSDFEPVGSPEQPASGLRTVVSSGVERQYFLNNPLAPETAAPVSASSVQASAERAAGPLPIVIAYHGYTGSYENWVGPNRFYDLIDVVGGEAIFVAPNGLPDASGARAWGGEADLNFFVDLLAELERIGVRFDPNRVFVAGHSNGAGFSHELACRYGDLIRGFAAAAGTLTSTDCFGSTGAILFQGSNDPLTSPSIAAGGLRYWVLYNGWEPDQFADSDIGPCVDYSLADRPDNLAYPVLWCEHTQGHDWPDFASVTAWDFLASLPLVEPTLDAPPGGGSERATPPRDAFLTFQLDVPLDSARPLSGAASLRKLSFIDNPICSAPDVILSSFSLDGLANPGEVSERITVPITYLDFSGLLEFPSEWALSITVYVEGGSTTVIPTPGVDQDAITPVMLIDRNTDLNIDEVLPLRPVQDLCGVL